MPPPLLVMSAPAPKNSPATPAPVSPPPQPAPAPVVSTPITTPIPAAAPLPEPQQTVPVVVAPPPPSSPRRSKFPKPIPPPSLNQPTRTPPRRLTKITHQKFPRPWQLRLVMSQFTINGTPATGRPSPRHRKKLFPHPRRCCRPIVSSAGCPAFRRLRDTCPDKGNRSTHRFRHSCPGHSA